MLPIRHQKKLYCNWISVKLQLHTLVPEKYECVLGVRAFNRSLTVDIVQVVGNVF